MDETVVVPPIAFGKFLKRFFMFVFCKGGPICSDAASYEAIEGAPLKKETPVRLAFELLSFITPPAPPPLAVLFIDEVVAMKFIGLSAVAFAILICGIFDRAEAIGGAS